MNEAKTQDDPAKKLSVSVPESLANAAKRAAAKDQRSLSSYIQSLIARDLEREKTAQLAH